MKLSHILNIISAILTLGLVIYLTSESVKKGCFDWTTYSISFLTLFGNLGISILSALED